MNDGWEGLLDEGETVLWQGQPDPAVRFAWRKKSRLVFFGAFTGISLFVTVRIALEGGYEWLFVLPFVAIGLYNLFFVHYWEAYLRRHTHYTITSRRAIIATEAMGRRSLESYPLVPDSVLRLEERDGLSDIYFAETVRTRRDDRRDGITRQRNSLKRIGFEQVRDGRRVYEILRQAQQQREEAPT